MAPDPETTTKITGFIGKLAQAGPLIGGFIGLLGAADGVNGVMDSFVRASVGNIHAPDATDINRWNMTGSGLMLTIGGMIVKGVGGGIHPVLGRVGQFLSGLGGGMMAGGVAGGLLYGMTHSDGGADHGMHHKLYQKPQAGWAGHFTMPTVPPATPTIAQINPSIPHP